MLCCYFGCCECRQKKKTITDEAITSNGVSQLEPKIEENGSNGLLGLHGSSGLNNKTSSIVPVDEMITSYGVIPALDILESKLEPIKELQNESISP